MMHVRATIGQPVRLSAEFCAKFPATEWLSALRGTIKSRKRNDGTALVLWDGHTRPQPVSIRNLEKA